MRVRRNRNDDLQDKQFDGVCGSGAGLFNSSGLVVSVRGILGKSVNAGLAPSDSMSPLHSLSISSRGCGAATLRAESALSQKGHRICPALNVRSKSVS